jgi:hypothetical protein
VPDPKDDYLVREAKARINIDRQFDAAGWVVQHADRAVVTAGPGVAVRESSSRRVTAGSTTSSSSAASQPA